MKKQSKTAIAAMKPNSAASEILTDAQVAQLLAVEPRTLRLWRHTRGLPFIKISSKAIRVRRSDLDAWLDRLRTVIS